MCGTTEDERGQINEYFSSVLIVEKVREGRGFRKENSDVLKHINITVCEGHEGG